MQNYVGYGFSTKNIKNETWLALVKTYDRDKFERYLSNQYRQIHGKEQNISADDHTVETENATDFILDMCGSLCEYLEQTINREESAKAGTDYIVSSYDDYLIFDSARFADDSPRTKYIQTQEDFITMIGQYVPLEPITFGNLYEGNEWQDPIYTLN